MTGRRALFLTAGLGALLAGAGCSRPQPPVAMAPPVQAPPPVAPQGGGEVFQWNDVPKGEKIPITRGVFDQGGYQLYARTGETIVVPFANQNMYVLKFGKSGSGETYFINDGEAPTLYVPNGGYLENASAQGAKWYPFPNEFRYERPVYMGIAPTWGDYMGMGWYPGMAFYGGYWGYRPWTPGFMYAPMVGLNINIGGRSYGGWDGYRSYYRSNPVNRVLVTNRSGYNYNTVGRRSGASFGTGRSSGGVGTARTGGSSSFGRSTGSGSSGFGRSTGGSFGSGNRTTPGGGFGSSSSGSGSFGRRSGTGSFGGGTSGFSSSRPSGSGSFGSSGSSSSGGFGRSSGGFGSSGSSSSGGSFGRSSGGFGSSGGSFGGGRRSGGFGGGFGGGRRR